jgi:superfamily II DNA/RNA helicase
VHRIGRTGRAGKMGNAISLVSAHEVGYLVDIEKLIKRPIEQVEVAGFEPEPEYEYPRATSASAARRPSRRQRPSAMNATTARSAANVAPPQPDDRGRWFRLQQAVRRNSPRGEVPDSPTHLPRLDPHKPKRSSLHCSAASAASKRTQKNGALRRHFFAYRLLRNATRHETRCGLARQASISLMIASDRLSPPPLALAGLVDQHFAGLAGRVLGDQHASSTSSK